MFYTAQDRMMDRYTFQVSIIEARDFTEAKEIYLAMVRKNIIDVNNLEVYDDKDDYAGYSYTHKEGYEVDGWLDKEPRKIHTKDDI